MNARSARLYLDFIDPVSYYLHRTIRGLEAGTGAEVERYPLEWTPPPRPLLSPDDPEWRRRRLRVAALLEEEGVRLREPAFLPWTRKAHELVLLGAEAGCADAVVDALFRAFLEEGLDIGRIDVLVGLAREAGLEAPAARAALDVDRFTAEVERRAATHPPGRGSPPPVLVRGDRALWGFHNPEAVRTFLAG